MNHTITGLTRTIAAIATATLIIAACGGGSSSTSSGRNLNSALDCYVDDAAKAAAVALAQAAFDTSLMSQARIDALDVRDKAQIAADDARKDHEDSQTELTLKNTNGQNLFDAFQLMSSDDPGRSAAEAAYLAAKDDLALFFSSVGTYHEARVAAATALDIAEEVLATLIATEAAAALLLTGPVVLTTAQQQAKDILDAANLQEVCEITDASTDETTPTAAATVSTDCPITITYNPVAPDITVSGCEVVTRIEIRIGASRNSTEQRQLRFPIGSDPSFNYIIYVGEQIAAQGHFSGDPTTQTITGEYQAVALSASVPSDTTLPSSADCTFTLTEANFRWDCNAPINIYQGAKLGDTTHGTYIKCSESGSYAASLESFLKWDEYTIVVGVDTQTDGQSTLHYAPTDGASVTAKINLPDGRVNTSCDQESGSSEYSDLAFSTAFTGHFRLYDLTLTDTQNVVITANSFQTDCYAPGNDPELYIYTGSAPQYSSDNLVDDPDDNLESDENCSAAGFDGELNAGNYIIRVVNDDFEGTDAPAAVVTIDSSVALVPFVWPGTPLPATQYSTSFNTYAREFPFTLTETTDVTFTASSNQSCSPNNFGGDNDGFVTPMSSLYTAAEWNNNGSSFVFSRVMYGSPTNCAVNIIQETLDAGDYVFRARNGDDDIGTITIGSSIEIGKPKNLSFTSMTTIQVKAPQSFDIVVPEGGVWFRAEGNSWQTEDCEVDCVDPVLILVDNNDNTVAISNNAGETVENYGASLIERFLPKGSYRIIATVYELYDPNDRYQGYATSYELVYGFASANSEPIPQVVVTPSTNNEMPADLPAPTDLPVSFMKVTGSAVGVSAIDAVMPAIEAGVTSMVCNATCIETLFTSAGINDGAIAITAGERTVTVKKGQKMAVIPVGDETNEISAVATSADGTQIIKLSTDVKIIDRQVQKALDSKTTTGVLASSSGSSNWPFVLAGLLLISILAVINARRKKAVTRA